MKNLLYLAFAAAAALALTACSTTAETPTTESPRPPALEAPALPDTIPPETDAPEQDGFTPIVLVDNDDVCVKITGTENDPVWGYTMNIYLENRTDQELLFTVDDVSINRYMCDPFWAESVGAGMKSNSSIYWFESSLAENSITDVEEIRFTLRVYDAADFFAEDVFLDSFTVTP